uniref:Uncharacterized protein n=1 Tax=viral metagenome TaxID=1070528 RepID=A0A6M3IET5_9ZZZZ
MIAGNLVERNAVAGGLLDTCRVKGTWTVASGTWTIPAVTLGGAITSAVALALARDVNTNYLYFTGGIDANSACIILSGKSRTGLEGNIEIYTPNAALTQTERLRISGGLDTAIATWSNITHTGLVLGGNMTVTGYAFDAGAGSAQINTTGAGCGLVLQSTQGGGDGAVLQFKQVTASLAVSDKPARIFVYDNDGAGANWLWAYTDWIVTDAGDGTEAMKMEWVLADGGVGNLAMTLSGAGVLAVDLSGSGAAAQVDLFDQYDDALILRQGIQQNNRELLADMGVLERKDTGSGYMMKIQPMVRLLAGGIYQSRQLIDDTKEELIERIEGLESKLKLLGAG